ncbi:HET-domain-containing protein, partial [Glonium stellatum]
NALYINQKDDEEKSWQVDMMDRIYKLAHHTIIYLGSLTTASEALLKALASSTTTTERGLTGDLDRSVVDSGRLDLLHRPWFSRVWVFQEMVFARDPWAQCGKIRLKWDRLAYESHSFSEIREPDLFDSVASHHSPSVSDGRDMILSEMQKARKSYQASLFSKVSKPDLLDLVVSRRGLGASDGRDMIFAHVKLASSPPNPLIAVDYRKSFVDVYADFALYAIQNYSLN